MTVQHVMVGEVNVSDLTGWQIVKDCDDGSLILQSPTGERKHIWQGGDEKLMQEIERLLAEVKFKLRLETIDLVAQAAASSDYYEAVRSHILDSLDTPD